ncbi:hypothetical protein NVP1253O_25 [Vibrio phage 1.253.O._10N.286.45.B12]|nr:hypothetical protein NVP1235O_25 [Vibrio phage 1.235.O._10N.261.52.B2]AUR98549.1 hypothetical protein NVP1253O_25 [Vibrio phage 1.253.O._10N.286.45.B12]
MTHKTYDLFNEMDNDLLQAWNRCNVLANIKKDNGDEEATKYFDNFNETEQMKMKMLLLSVSTSGKAEVYRKIQESMDETSK